MVKHFQALSGSIKWSSHSTGPIIADNPYCPFDQNVSSLDDKMSLLFVHSCLLSYNEGQKENQKI